MPAMANGAALSAPKVSVLMLTYNHVAFLAQALDSVLLQVADFMIEIVLADDCSTDGITAIVAEYERRYPTVVRALYTPTNLGLQANLMRALPACRGQYITGLDGDDYWVRSDVLATLAAFLDTHPDCSLAFGDATMVDTSGHAGSSLMVPAARKGLSDLRAILMTNFIPSCAAMARREVASDLPPWMLDLPCPDWLQHILTARHGAIGYVDHVMAVYRVHERGVWSSLPSSQKLAGEIRMFEHLRHILEPSYRDVITELIRQRLVVLSWAYARSGDRARARHCARRYAAIQWSHGHILDWRVIRTLLHVYVPRVLLLARWVRARGATRLPGRHDA